MCDSILSWKQSQPRGSCSSPCPVQFWRRYSTASAEKLFQCIITVTVKKNLVKHYKFTVLQLVSLAFNLVGYKALRRIRLHLCCQTVSQFPRKAVSSPVWAKPAPSASIYRASVPAFNCLDGFCWSWSDMPMSVLFCTGTALSCWWRSSSKVAWWAPGSHPRSTHHSFIIFVLWR